MTTEEACGITHLGANDFAEAQTYYDGRKLVILICLPGFFVAHIILPLKILVAANNFFCGALS